MNLFILSASKTSEGLLNNYRHDMLRRTLENLVYCPTDGTGNDGTGEERVLVISSAGWTEEERHDFMQKAALFCEIFEQDYYVEVRNDTMYAHTGVGQTELGVVFRTDEPWCPQIVREAVAGGRYSRWGDYEIGVMTPDMAIEHTARSTIQAESAMYPKTQAGRWVCSPFDDALVVPSDEEAGHMVAAGPLYNHSGSIESAMTARRNQRY